MHGAQTTDEKLSNTTEPLRDSSETLLPVRSANSIGGAYLPISVPVSDTVRDASALPPEKGRKKEKTEKRKTINRNI
jgi:hypothetical protein